MKGSCYTINSTIAPKCPPDVYVVIINISLPKPATSL